MTSQIHTPSTTASPIPAIAPITFGDLIENIHTHQSGRIIAIASKAGKPCQFEIELRNGRHRWFAAADIRKIPVTPITSAAEIIHHPVSAATPIRTPAIGHIISIAGFASAGLLILATTFGLTQT